VTARSTRFSVTEIETLRRDPYAIYARHVLGLDALEPLLRDPGAAERGNLFHDILHAFNEAGIDPGDPSALDVLLETGRRVFDAADLPPDVDAVWWPRFERQAAAIIGWERGRGAIGHRHAELSASETPIGVTGALLRGRADRIDMRAGGNAEIIDFKTGSSPSKRQAFTLLSPQLALEGALLMKGAFAAIGPATPTALAYVRLKANGTVAEESILKHDGEEKTADELSLEAWQRLEKLIAHYQEAEAGYLSRALPFRESEVSGTYDHLARVLEWSAGSDEAEEAPE
jgi:ATP-dependent helicase/nuclease subunit B